MTDSHAHLTMEPVKSSVQSHLWEFKEKGGLHILNISYDIQTIGEVIEQSLLYENSFPNILLSSIGVHPESITEDIKNFNNAKNTILETLSTHKKRIQAIGECGLDYYHLEFASQLNEEEKENLKDKQKQLFRDQIEIARDFKLPLSIHTRDISNETKCSADSLKIISSVGKGKVRGSYHSYTGSKEYLNEILNLGFYVGFNGIVTYPKAENVRELLRLTPIEKILLETDTPLLPPQNVRNGKTKSVKYGTPVDVFDIAQTISKVKDIKIEKVLEITTQNFQNLFLSN